MTGLANRPGAALAAWMLLLAGTCAPAGWAEDFTAQTAAAEQLQSRRYQAVDVTILLKASLAVLQDIRFLVTRSEVDPPLLVAQAPRRACAGDLSLLIAPAQSQGCAGDLSLTISVQPVIEQNNVYQVRLTASAPPKAVLFGAPKPVDHTAFYQDFFTHLDRELFKRRPS